MLFGAVELVSSGAAVVHALSDWSHHASASIHSVQSPQTSPQAYRKALAQNTTAGMHDDVFWQGDFGEGIIAQPSPANIAAAVAIIMNAMGDHSPAAATLAACSITAENGLMDAYWEGPVRTHLFHELKNHSFVGQAAEQLPVDTNASCITIDAQLLPQNAIFALPAGSPPVTVGR